LKKWSVCRAVCGEIGLLSFALWLACASAAAQTTVAVDPPALTVSTPSAFSLNFVVHDVTDLHTASVTCTFDPAVLSCSGVEVGSFLTENGMVFSTKTKHGPLVDSLVVDVTIMGPMLVSGSGVIAVATFSPVNAGVTPVGVSNIVLLGDSNYVTRIPASGIAGEVTVETTVPVTIASFVATHIAAAGGVRLQWATLSEIDNYGFLIDRRRHGESAFAEVSGSFIAGNGTTLDPHTYEFIDNTIAGPGHYEYRLRQIDQDGTVHYFEGASVNVVLSSVSEAVPGEFALQQNYPNPFNPVTSIRYSVGVVRLPAGQAGGQLPAASSVKLAVYDLLGREVAVLVDGSVAPGNYEVQFDGSRLSSGTYIYRLTTGERMETKRMVLVR
jgi:hypothetical protein